MSGLTDISVIRGVLSRHGFRFSKALGQNFLTAAWVPERIAGECLADADTAVLEIGPGIGCLTRELAQRAGGVLCVELDGRLRPVLAETLAGCGNVRTVFGDAMKLDLEALMDEHFPGMRHVVCANLPYNITTPVLAKLYGCTEFGCITVMIQREVARRLCARPGSADYGAFSVFTQWNCEPEVLFDVAPGCFMPPPKVTSTVIRLRRREQPPCPVRDEELLFRTVRAAFNQRRKTLVNALAPAFPDAGRPALAAAVAGAGLDVRVRGEALGIPEFAALADRLAEL